MNLKQFITISIGILLPIWIGTSCYLVTKYPKNPPTWALIVVTAPFVIIALTLWFVMFVIIYKDFGDK